MLLTGAWDGYKMSEDRRAVHQAAETKSKIAHAGGGFAAGGIAAQLIKPDVALKVWNDLNVALGAIGIVLLIPLGIALMVNYFLWEHYKAEQRECTAEVGRTRESWLKVVEKIEAQAETRQQEARAERQVMAGIVATLTQQVTLMNDRRARMPSTTVDG